MVNYDMLEAIVRGTRGVREEDRPHASRGGRAYPKEVREMVIEMMLTGGIAAVKTPVVTSLQTCRRWLRQHVMLGHVLPKRASGNKVATREITREALMQLALYRVIRPHARLYEVRAYIGLCFEHLISLVTDLLSMSSIPFTPFLRWVVKKWRM